MDCAGFPRTRCGRGSLSSEARRSAPTPQETWLLPQAGGSVPLAVGQCDHGSGRGGPPACESLQCLFLHARSAVGCPCPKSAHELALALAAAGAGLRPRLIGRTFADGGESGRRVMVGELTRLLEKDGWRLARARGSHRQHKHPSKPGTVTVAGKPTLDGPPGTPNSLRKRAGLKK